MGHIENPAIPQQDCTLSTCSLQEAHYDYLPSLAGNALYLAIFSLLLIAQVGLGIRSRAWGFLVGMFGGLSLEIIGYVGRVQMHSNPFIDQPFLMSLVCLTIGPAFLAGSIYLCLARIVVVFGQDLSRFKPRTYTITFMSCDFISLLLQAAGGAIASGANTVSSTNLGVNIMIAGLSFQVASLLLFMGLCAEFAWRVSRNHEAKNPRFETLRASSKFKAFLYCLAICTIGIFIRSVYRVAELSQGFGGKLANQEITFMILEGAMIIIGISAITIMHPHFAFGGAWNEAVWSLRGRKSAENEGYGQRKSNENQGEEMI